MPLSKPVKINNPILTVRWIGTEMQGNIGPDLKFTLKVNNAKSIQGNLKTKNKCIYQNVLEGFVHGQGYTNSLEISVTEKDPVKPYGPVFFKEDFEVKTEPSLTIPIDKAIAPIKHKAVDDDGNYGIRVANFTFNCRWYLAADVVDVIYYISSEMDTNGISREVMTIKELNDIYNATGGWVEKIGLFPKERFLAKVLAFCYWASLVGPKKPWDHKPSIIPAFGSYSLDAEKGKSYFFDIWSNMHYGYVGRVAGFTNTELINGAAIAQAIDDILDTIKQSLDKIIEGITQFDPSKVRKGFKEIEENVALRKKLKEIFKKLKDKNISGLDNPDDTGSIRLGSEGVYDMYGNSFTNTKESRQFMLDLIRKRRRYSKGSNVKIDAKEGVCKLT